MGFSNIKAWADSGSDDGKNWISSFRKVPAVVTIAGQWFDFSGTTGNPVPNYYASSPLVAARLDQEKGIWHGGDVSPATKYVHRWTFVNGSGGATTTTSQNLSLMLLDYLLYYPFVDMDAAGEEQILDNTVPLNRSVDGEGVRMMLVAQSPTVGGGQFTITYTNQDGVSGRVTPNHLCAAASPIGALVQATQAATGVQPFVSLQDGDTGVQSVQSVTFSVANGGLASLVLVKPIMSMYSREESRRSTGGSAASFGSPTEAESVSRRAGPGGRIEDGAYIGFIGQTTAGSVSAAQMVGTLETIWR